jgi:hypothetical protein
MASAALVPIMRGDVGLHLGVQAQHVDDDLHFIEEAIREQRADRAVDQAAGQRLQFARAAFTLEEAAGDLAGGVGLLDVVDGQREEVLAGLGLGLGHHGGQHHGVFDAADHGAGGLAGDLAGFQRDGVLAPLEGLGDLVEHAHEVSGSGFGAGAVAPDTPGFGSAPRNAIPASPAVGRPWNDTAACVLADS